jgi:hypothetical protein
MSSRLSRPTLQRRRQPFSRAGITAADSRPSVSAKLAALTSDP